MMRSIFLGMVLIGLAACSFGPAPKTAASAAPETGSEEYAVGPDDVLQVEVWKHPELSKEVTVRPDGYISLPLINEVRAAGLSSSILAQAVKERLKEFVEDPEVTITVRTANSYKIYVLGKVTTSGMFTVKIPVSVLQAIAMAGGFTPFASPDRMIVLRKVDNKDVRIEVNYDQILDGRHPAKNIILKPGDTLVVP